MLKLKFHCKSVPILKKKKKTAEKKWQIWKSNYFKEVAALKKQLFEKDKCWIEIVTLKI